MIVSMNSSFSARINTVRPAAGREEGAVSVSNIDISHQTDTDCDKTIITAYFKAIDDALRELTLSASVIGASKSRVEGNKTFVRNLIDGNIRGAGQLIDADLLEEAIKLKALQTQEQIVSQSLGIVNNNSQSSLQIIDLFV